jgi:hypothetical protein
LGLTSKVSARTNGEIGDMMFEYRTGHSIEELLEAIGLLKGAAKEVGMHKEKETTRLQGLPGR